MWKHLRENFQIVKVRVLHQRLSNNSSVAILRGVPEDSRLSPTLFGIFVADLIHELKENFPNATITHNGGFRWIGGILYVDNLCLISTDAHELQMMINTCQTWSEKALMQLNADKTKIMCFHETTQVRNAREKPLKSQGKSVWPAPFHILSMFPDYINPNSTPHTHNFYLHPCKKWSRLIISDSNSTPCWLWNQQWHPPRKKPTKVTP